MKRNTSSFNIDFEIEELSPIDYNMHDNTARVLGSANGTNGM